MIYINLININIKEINCIKIQKDNNKNNKILF